MNYKPACLISLRNGILDKIYRFLKSKSRRLVLLCVFLLFSISLTWYVMNFEGLSLQEIVTRFHGRESRFEDTYFKRILVEFQHNVSTSIFKRHEFRKGKIPRFLLISHKSIGQKFWEMQMKHIVLNECPFSCEYVSDPKEIDSVDAVVFYLRNWKGRKDMEAVLPRRDLTQPWIMLTFESPLLATHNSHLALYKQYDAVFNRTMMYRLDADIIVSHGFVVSKKDAEKLPYRWRVPSNNFTVFSKTKMSIIVALISNCKDKSGRLGYIKELQKYIKVDIYGKCGNMKCGHSLYVTHGYKPYEDKCLQQLGSKYMFYLAFENAICKDYGTEKIYNLLYYPIVPIVLGGINYDEILPPHSFINAAHYSPKKLAEYVQYLVSNDDEYSKYFSWRSSYVPSTVGGERILCDLCTRLNDDYFYQHNVISNFSKWFYSDSKCERRWTTDNEFNLGY